MTVSETLKLARELILDKGSWTQGTIEDIADNGRTTRCAIGAIVAVVLDGTERYMAHPRRYLNDAAQALFGSNEEILERFGNHTEAHHPENYYPVVLVNDTIGHAATIEMFDYAIKIAERDEHDAD